MTVGAPPKQGFGFLGEILVRHGVLSAERLAAALLEQKGRGGRLGQVLVDAGFCTDEQIARALAAQFRLPFAAVAPAELDLATARRLGLDFLRRHVIAPLTSKGRLPRLAVADPLDVEPVDRAQAMLGGPCETLVALRRDVLAALDHAARLDASGPNPAAEGRDDDASDLLREMLLKAVRARATDVHLEPEEHSFRVRYRIDGVLRQGGSFPKEKGPLIVSCMKMLSQLDVCEHRLPQDGRARLDAPSGQVDLRVSTLPTTFGESCVVRLLDRARGVPPPSELDLRPRILEPLSGIALRSHGLLLVTGPTGSGKTTTLYSLLSTIDALERKVITVEDPVEYQFPMVRQVQVHADVGLTFAVALRSILRHDPEVVLVGEIRDRETAEIAVRAALTGHLVLSTLHTNSATGAVARLLDMGVDPFLVTATLSGVVGQRLARRLCRECSTPHPLSQAERDALPEAVRAAPDLRRAPKGCEVCGGTGFLGRIGLHELVVPDDAFRAAVMRRASESELTAAAEAAGFLPMSVDGAEKTLAGLTTAAEILRVVS
ncbi:MAG TPA: GspE/PulE family protein [Planctomycetota bacterium]|nr:GspE/PulE family protein [Planctomycetota bacterium]